MKRLLFTALLLGCVEVSGQVRFRTIDNISITTDTPIQSVIEDSPITTVTLAASGGSGVYSAWAVTSGSLPTGLSLNSGTGEITGTPTTANLYTFTIRVTDSAGLQASKEFTWTIQASGALPAGWTADNVGSVTAGTCTFSVDTFSMTGPGSPGGITYNTSDRFTLCYQAVTGNKYIEANITACTATGLSFGRECGLMVRQSLAVGSAHASCKFGESGSPVPVTEWRANTNGTTSSDIGATRAATTGWLRMQVVSGTPNCAVSEDGTTWTTVPMSGPPVMSGTYYVALVLDGNDIGVASATFEDVTVGDFTPPSSGPDYLGYRPHYQGPFADTTGGRTGGTRVCDVNTLTISGTPTWGATGDLRDCLQGLPPGCTAFTGSQAACARFVTVSVSGYTTAGPPTSFGVNLINITGPYLTFAGQTAPQDGEGSCSANCGSPGGLTVTDTHIRVNAHDVVIQHLRVIGGDYRECFDTNCSELADYSISVGDSTVAQFPPGPGSEHVYNVAIDHATIMWIIGLTHGFSVGGGANQIGILDSFFAEPIYATAPGGYCVAMDRYTDEIAYFRNLHAHCWGRNPAMGIGGLMYGTNGCTTGPPCQHRIAFGNNIIYNGTDNSDWAGGAVYGWVLWSFRQDDPQDGPIGTLAAAFVGNRWIAGPNSGSPAGGLAIAIGKSAFNSGGPATAYLADNSDNFGCINASSGNGQWACFNSGTQSEYPSNVVTAGSGSNIKTTTLPALWSDYDFQVYPNYGVTTTLDAVTNNAGAYPAFRDTQQQRIISEVRNGTGSGNQLLAPGDRPISLITLARRSRTCSPPSNPNTVYDAESGRTRIEVWLEGIDDLDGTADCDARRVEVTQGVE